VVYISANPIINSKISVKGFNAKEHFFKIIDVWAMGWDEKWGTVPPEKVNEALEKYKEIYPERKFILHYLQPHEPYLGDIRSVGFNKPNHGVVLGNSQSSYVNKYEVLIKIFSLLAKKFNILGNKPSWKIREFLNLPPVTPMDEVRRKYGDIGLRKAYENNLIVVLESVKNLVRGLSGRIIITSDHGELLGENGNYSHGIKCMDPLLVEIPWFLIYESKEQ